MFTSDPILLEKIVVELSACGCCARCTLRYMGLKDMYTYKGGAQEMEKIVNSYVNSRATSESRGDLHVVPEKECEASSNGARTADNVTSCIADTEASADEVKCVNMEGKDLGVSKVDEKFEDKKPLPCVICLGILQKFCSEEYLNELKQQINDAGFQSSTYMCSLMIPVCILLREHAVMLHLKETFKTVYDSKQYTDVAQIKDVWKWRCGPLLTDKLAKTFDVKSTFEITLTFQYEFSNKECSFLLDTHCTFRKRKQDRRHNRRKKTFDLYTRANVGTAIGELSDTTFKGGYQCPPAEPRAYTTCDIKCQSENIFVAGRYNKYSRTLSQTPWIIDGVSKTESSVEELLGKEIYKNFKPSESKFSSSGREDVDVLMLGNGRPFVLELLNPKRREFTQEQMTHMQKCINESARDLIKCIDLQIVPREETDILKEGEIDKVKNYSALCWSKLPITDEQLNILSISEDLTILQKTPIRVLHRRSLATRARIIHSMSAKRVDENHFRLDLSTQAGTYIKEFIHGDFGRTKPTVSSLVSQDCDIVELDVTSIELCWPKKIEVLEEHVT